MPCPFFEPQQIVDPPTYSHARLPLLDEYDGVCHADHDLIRVPAEMRFSGCNHGNRVPPCNKVQIPQKAGVLRFTVLGMTTEAVEVLMLQERDHRPVSWQNITYFLLDERLQPEPTETCERTQVLAFCRSYTRRVAEVVR
jgi:hypothetical protein